MRLDALTAVVVGAGTGGAGVALLLARAGVRVTLLERVAQPRAVGAGIAVAPNGLAVLEALGLLLGIEAGSRLLSAPRVVDAAGRTLFTPPEPAPTMRMMRRSALQALLLDAVAAEPRIDARYGVELIAATPDGEIVATEHERETRLRADLVIGADGVHSAVRTTGGFDARVGGSGIVYMRTLVKGGLDTGVEAWTPAGLFGAFPVPDGTYVYSSAGSVACRRAVASADLRAFRTAWAEDYPDSVPALDAVAAWDDLLLNPVVTVDCRRWSRGRLVLVGDAAHAMPPNLGQGANSALVDAAVLLLELRRHADLPAGLDAYERRRRPAVRRVAAASARLGALAELTHPLGRTARDRVLMPIVQRLRTPAQLAMALQEPVDELRRVLQ